MSDGSPEHVSVGPPVEEVEFGLILALTIRGLSLGSYTDIRDVAQRAEGAGYDSVWMCDHFLTLDPDGYGDTLGLAGEASGSEDDGPATMPLLECWTTLAALARDTERVNLGTSVLCNNYRPPAVLAKMAATLDVISDGRVELGLGAGWFKDEYEAYGIDFPPAGVRVSQLEESLELIRRIWTDPVPTFVGEHYRIEGAICDPPPLQDPHPRLWIGGEGDRVHRIATRLASGFNARWWAPERFEARAGFLADACEGHGRDPETVHRSATLALLCGTDVPALEQQRARFSAIPDAGFVLGTPDDCVARLKEYVDAGVSHFLFTVPDVVENPGPELAAQEVLPEIRAYAHDRASSSA